MSTLTIVKSDGFVSVDGVGYFALDCTSLDSNVHAIQFDGTNGWVEYNDGTDNLDITSISSYSTITDFWDSAKATEDAATAARVAAGAVEKAKEANYDWKRVNHPTTKYASIADQLDQQYKDALNGTTTWRDAITVVKDAHPKP